MRLSAAERAEIVAAMHKLMAEKRNRVHVISSRGGWSVFSEGPRRSRKAFKVKEDAVAYGRELAGRFRSELVVHRTDGDLETWESFPELLSARG